MLKDGRVGFIDFGIVGSISPVTWAAVESLVRSATINDFDLMARALVTMGMTDQQVDIPVSNISPSALQIYGSHPHRSSNQQAS